MRFPLTSVAGCQTRLAKPWPGGQAKAQSLGFSHNVSSRVTVEFKKGELVFETKAAKK